MSFTSYVSANGLGQSYTGLTKPALIAAIIVAGGVAAVIGGGFALAVAGAGLVVAILVGAIAKTRLGGANGDVYGASIELVAAVCVIGAAGVVDAGGMFEPVWTTL
jgi:cobalamin synthase